jgi:predicted RNA-binding protein
MNLFLKRVKIVRQKIVACHIIYLPLFLYLGFTDSKRREEKIFQIKTMLKNI